MIVDSVTGLKRNLTISETKAIRKFSSIISEMPSDTRLEVLSSINAAEESLSILIKDLPDEQKELVKFTLSQYTGLAALQAVAEMYNVSKLNAVFTPSDLVEINTQIAQSQNLVTVIDNSLSELLQTNPNNAQVQNFADKIQENIKLINDDIKAKLEEDKKEFDKIVSDFEKDMEKEMLNDQKKNIKV